MEATGPLRAVRSWEEALPQHEPEQRTVREAMLLTAGELGYAKATVAEVARRAGISEDRFQRRHGGKAACFAAAYAEAADELVGRLEATCAAAPEWREGFRAALAELLATVAEQPHLAKALLIEAKAARGAAWAKHQEVVARLTERIDEARAEHGARPGANRFAAGFVLGAIEETLCIELAAGNSDAAPFLLDDLTRIAHLQLFGEDES